MTSSQIYGPIQVRDLSESWGKAKTIRTTNEGCAICVIGEGHCDLTDIGACLSYNPLKHSNIGHCSYICSKRKPSVARTGALVKSVRGSIPSSVISGQDFCPNLLNGGVQWSDTATVKSNCGQT